MQRVRLCVVHTAEKGLPEASIPRVYDGKIGSMAAKKDLRRVLYILCLGLAWVYAAGIAIWFVLFAFLGDSLWWLSLMHIFAPYYFLPLPLFLLGGIFLRKMGYWAGLFLPLLIFLFLFGDLFLPDRKTPLCPGQPPLTVVTFNRYGFSGELTLDAMRRTGLPDILVLQESLPHQQTDTVQSLQSELPHYLVTGNMGLALFSRYPVQDLPSNHLQDPDWFVLKARVFTPSGEVTVYNVHMTTTRILGYLSEPGFIPEIVHYTADARREMTRRLMTDMALEQTPIILMGDFNSTPLNDPARLLDNRMTDAFEEAGWGFGHTFPSTRLAIGPLRSFSRMVRIDMIFVSSEFEVTGAWVGAFFGESDHLPVAAQLAWNVCESP
jgi:endonuclease/exonuclease/phosphatase family metal-dependent hydrolase